MQKYIAFKASASSIEQDGFASRKTFNVLSLKHQACVTWLYEIQ